MKFEIGDKVKGLSDTYGITNTDMYLGEIKKVSDHYIKILVLEHKDFNEIGNVYTAYYPEGMFEIVKRKNGKFFKKLPNDFTGTLEVENGFIVEKEILDDAEREYLENIIKPFRNKISNISKEPSIFGKEFICIGFKNEEFMCFPYFKKNTMYKGMELNRKYSLEELGLDE